jgi:hypothetical protein
MKRHFNYFVAILILCTNFLSIVHADQAIWDKSPKDLFELIGNQQADLPDRDSAYENLKDNASRISGSQATNNIEAAYYLAECYVSGKTGDGGPIYARNQKGFSPNRPEAYKLALPLYEDAAQNNHIPSLVKLSSLYADGNYVPKDLDKSLTYLVKAAKLGDKDSLGKLLPMYSTGFPGVTNETQKFMGMEVLADGGNPEAQIELSKWLISKESKESFDDAKHFLVPLADKGNVSAIALLKEMESKVNAARAEGQKAQELQIEKKQSQEAATQTAQRRSDTEGVIFIIVAITVFLLAIIGTILGLSEKAIVYNGKSDLVVSCIITGILFVATLFALVGKDGMQFSVVLGVLDGFLLIYSARKSYVANQKSIGMTLVVVPTK